jgi:hypothetical protein
VINGGFEEPVLGGSAQNFSPGDLTLTGWTITGNSVLLLTNDYSENSGTLQFDSRSGNQHLDLTGAGNTGLRSIDQDVAIVPAARYLLSFWVGNQDDTRVNYVLPSTVNLSVNGSFVNAYTNAGDTIGNLNWKQFQYGFVATSALTNLRFGNATPIGDNMLGLDDVSLDLDSSNVPEPGSVALLGIGLTGFAALRRH